MSSESPLHQVPRTMRRPDLVFVRFSAIQSALEWSFWLLGLLWWVVELDLEPFELVLTGTVFEIALLSTEVPTGVVADLYSRKWSIVVSNVLMGVAMMLSVATRSLAVVLAAQALFAIAWTFQSGADIAWVTAETEGDDVDLELLLLRRHRAGMLLAVPFLVVAAAIGSWSIRGGIAIIGGLLVLLGAAMSVLMVENNFTPGRSSGESFRSTLRSGIALVRRRPRLRRLLLVMVVAGLPSEALDRLGFKRFFDVGNWDDSALWFNLVLLIGAAATGLAFNHLATRAVKAGHPGPKIIAVLLLVAAIGALTIAASGLILVIGIGLLLQDGARESFDPVVEHWTNTEADDAVRATVHSLAGQGFAVGEIFGGLALGAIASATSLWVAIAVAAAALTAGALIARRPSPVDQLAGS